MAGVNRRKLLLRITQSPTNVRFGDMVDLVQAFGFRLKRVSGSHHIFQHSDLPESLTLQEVHGQAKPYQIRQFLRIAERYNLVMKD